MRNIWKSTYVKATIAFVVAGTLLLFINNGMKNANTIGIFSKINDTLIPVYIGIFVAFLMCPLYNRIVKYMYRRLKESDDKGPFVKIPMRMDVGKKRPGDTKKTLEHRSYLILSKTIATLTCTIVIFGSMALLGYFILPEVMKSVVNLISTMPSRMDSFSKWTEVHWTKFPAAVETVRKIADASSSEVIKWLKENILNGKGEDIFTSVSGQAISILGSVFDAFIGVLIAIYLLNYKERLFAIGRKIVSATCQNRRANNIYEFFAIINETFIGFMVGRILDAIVIGVLTYLGMLVIGVQMPLLISVIIGVTNIIPFFGPFIGAIPSFCLIFLSDPVKAVYFLILIFIIQQIDGNVIGPKIVGDAIGIGSFWVLLSVLIGGGLFGFIGMALGVPCFAVIYRYMAKMTNKKLESKDLEIDTEKYMDYEKFGVKSEEMENHES